MVCRVGTGSRRYVVRIGFGMSDLVGDVMVGQSNGSEMFGTAGVRHLL